MIIGNKNISNIKSFALSQIGASHKDYEICEDYSGSYQDDIMSIVCVADGHGDSRCVRANIGSQIAVEVGIQAVREFMANQPNIDFKDTKEADKAFVQLKTYILYKWIEKIKEHLDYNPLKDDERGLMDIEMQEEYERDGTIKYFPLLYGSTFILACVTNGFYFALQLGDGDVVLRTKKAYSFPMPEDERCVGNFTTSLCNSDAIDSFRHFYEKGSPRALFVCTDGLKNSFAESKFLFLFLEKVGENVVESGEVKAVNDLSVFLDTLSEMGSRDDISIGAIIDIGE